MDGVPAATTGNLVDVQERVVGVQEGVPQNGGDTLATKSRKNKRVSTEVKLMIGNIKDLH
jgi:hypothetical protein